MVKVRQDRTIDSFEVVGGHPLLQQRRWIAQSKSRPIVELHPTRTTIVHVRPRTGQKRPFTKMPLLVEV
jgi:hypothetical protein